MTLKLTSENSVDPFAPRHNCVHTHCRCSINVWVNAEYSVQLPPDRHLSLPALVCREGPVAAISGDEAGNSLHWLVVATSVTSRETSLLCAPEKHLANPELDTASFCDCSAFHD